MGWISWQGGAFAVRCSESRSTHTCTQNDHIEFPTVECYVSISEMQRIWCGVCEELELSEKEGTEIMRVEMRATKIEIRRKLKE
jgi:hypothetical protein